MIPITRIGKSRLCHEFVRACERDGVKVHRSSGVPYASRLPMFPFRELLRSKLGFLLLSPSAGV